MTTSKKNLVLLCLVLASSILSFGELSEAGRAYCNTTSVSVSQEGRPLSGPDGFETFTKLYLVPEPALLGLAILALALTLRNHQPTGKL